MTTRKTTSSLNHASRKNISTKASGSNAVPGKYSSPTTANRSASPSTAIVSELRKGFGVSRKVFARLSNFSERAIANWESGVAISPNIKRQMQELDRLRQSLAGVMDADYVGEWLQEPNDAFDGLKPLEVIERGQTDRIWRMIYILESGSPS